MTSAHSARGSKAHEAVLRELKEKLIVAGRILDMEELVRPLGHITVRVPGTETFLITRGVSPGMATVDDIVVCDMDGKVIEGKYSQTFGEVLGHVGVYRKRKDIQSVAHTHSWNVMALSMTETTIVPASFESIKVAYEPIALYKRVSFLDNLDVTEEIADLIGPNRAVILKGHGAIVVGKSIEEATVSAIDLERAAKAQFMAACAGKLVPFTEKEMEPLVRFLRNIEAHVGTTNPFGRAWEYYKSRLVK
jgi:ribulose-5-phosphate 4-epimerase/fuculose-1-phosphate aldolase